jgi:hypothetical protein
MDLLAILHGNAIDTSNSGQRRALRYERKAKYVAPDTPIAKQPTTDYRLLTGHQLADRRYVESRTWMTPQHERWGELSPDVQAKLLARLKLQ